MASEEFGRQADRVAELLAQRAKRKLGVPRELRAVDTRVEHDTHGVLTEDTVNELTTAMERLMDARMMASLAEQVGNLTAEDARATLQRIKFIIDEVHNDIGVLRETLEKTQ